MPPLRAHLAPHLVLLALSIRTGAVPLRATRSDSLQEPATSLVAEDVDLFGCTCDKLTDADLTPMQQQTVEARMGAFGDAVDKVQSYAMFFGYGRSGHTLVGALLDGHPSVALANEFDAPNELAKHPDWGRNELFRRLALNDARCAVHGRTQTSTNYSFDGTLPWQGRWCTEVYGPVCTPTNVTVIGDKKGGAATASMVTAGIQPLSPTGLSEEQVRAQILVKLQVLSALVQLPMRTIHVLRNPFDITAIGVLARLSLDPSSQSSGNCSVPTAAYRRETRLVQSHSPLLCAIEGYCHLVLKNVVDQTRKLLVVNGRIRQVIAAGTSTGTSTTGLSGCVTNQQGAMAGECAPTAINAFAGGGAVSWIDVAYESFAVDPAATLISLCKFLGVPAPASYISAAAAKVDPSGGGTPRDLLQWPPALVAQVNSALADLAASDIGTSMTRGPACLAETVDVLSPDACMAARTRGLSPCSSSLPRPSTPAPSPIQYPSRAASPPRGVPLIPRHARITGSPHPSGRHDGGGAISDHRGLYRLRWPTYVRFGPVRGAKRLRISAACGLRWRVRRC